MGSFAEKEAKLISHLTLYVGEPLLSDGGTVIVASIPIPVDEWRALQGLNLAAEDPENRKRPSLTDKDRLFGVAINARANVVEMYYPEGGTFGFDLVPNFRNHTPKDLQTERILVGSGGWTEWSTSTTSKWPSMSVIHVKGRKAREADSHIVSDSFSRILNLGVSRIDYAGASVMSPTAAQLSEGTFGEVK